MHRSGFESTPDSGPVDSLEETCPPDPRKMNAITGCWGIRCSEVSSLSQHCNLGSPLKESQGNQFASKTDTHGQSGANSVAQMERHYVHAQSSKLSTGPAADL